MVSASVSIARRLRPWLDSHPRVARLLKPYYSSAVSALRVFGLSRLDRGIHAVCVKHTHWVWGRSDVDPFFFTDFRKGVDPVEFLQQFWMRYDALRSAFPLLSSHWELRLARLEDFDDHCRWDGPASAFLSQAENWVAVVGTSRIRELRSRMPNPLSALPGFSQPATRIVDFKLNEVMQGQIWNQPPIRSGTLTQLGMSRYRMDLNAFFDLFSGGDLGPEPEISAGLAGLFPLVDRYDRWCKAYRPPAGVSLDLGESNRAEFPDWVVQEWRDRIRTIERLLPSEASCVLFRTSTFWRPVRLAVIVDPRSDRAALVRNEAALRQELGGLQRAGVSCFFATPAILFAQCMGLGEFDPREPELRAQDGVYDPGRVHPLFVPCEEIRRLRTRQLATDFLEIYLPRLLHRDLRRDPLHRLPEFQTFAANFVPEQEAPAFLELSGGSAYLEGTRRASEYQRRSRKVESAGAILLGSRSSPE